MTILIFQYGSGNGIGFSVFMASTSKEFMGFDFSLTVLRWKDLVVSIFYFIGNEWED